MRIVRDLAAVSAEEIAMSREAVVAIGEGEVSGEAAAVLMLADYAVLVEDRQSCLSIGVEDRQSCRSVDHDARVRTPAPPLSGLYAALVWRLGANALSMVLSGKTKFSPGEAVAAGLCDATEWKFENRSGVAFDVAAELIARRGGDTLERAAFARLFATGEPQQGLAAFLEKRPPGFSVA